MTDQTMAGRTVLVTGASDGIGAETARELAARGATVHVTGRSADKLRPVAEAVGTEPLVADFSVSTTYAGWRGRSGSGWSASTY